MATPSQVGLASAAVGGRRQRMSLEQVEEQVLETAKTLLIDQQGGLTVSLDHINLEVIIAAAGVPRSSAFRRWPRKEDFAVDFLIHIAGPDWAGTAAFDEATIRLAIQTLQENIELLTDDEGARRRLLYEIVRKAARQNYEATTQHAEWRTYVALTATVASMTDEDAKTRIKERLLASETTFIERMTRFYSVMAGMIGFRLREPFTYWHLAAAGAAIVEGLSLRQTVGVEMVDATIPIPNEDGEEQDWVLAAWGFRAVLDSMMILDDDFKATEETRAFIAASSVDDLMKMLKDDSQQE